MSAAAEVISRFLSGHAPPDSLATASVPLQLLLQRDLLLHICRDNSLLLAWDTPDGASPWVGPCVWPCAVAG